jgi:hypothetical protein
MKKFLMVLLSIAFVMNPVESNPARFRLRSPTGFFLPQTKDKAH